MSGYKNFAIVGAGGVGKFIIDELLQLKAAGTISEVVVVSRSDAATTEWKAQGAKFFVVDYDSTSDLASAFAGIDVVISTIGIPGLSKQLQIVEAVKSAGVKLFVPSEYGTPMEEFTGGMFDQKKAVQAKSKALGLPYVLFYTGLFSDFVFAPFLGFDLANGKVTVGGSGDTQMSFTGRIDIARFIGHVLTTLPPSKLEWKSFHIEGDRLSFNEIISAYEKKTGKKQVVTYTSTDQLKENIAKNPEDVVSTLQLTFELGYGVVGKDIDNDVWPIWNPKKVLEIIA